MIPMIRPAFAMVCEPRLYPPTAMSFLALVAAKIAIGPSKAQTVSDRMPSTIAPVALPQDLSPYLSRPQGFTDRLAALGAGPTDGGTADVVATLEAAEFGGVDGSAVVHHDYIVVVLARSPEYQQSKPS